MSNDSRTRAIEMPDGIPHVLTLSDARWWIVLDDLLIRGVVNLKALSRTCWDFHRQHRNEPLDVLVEYAICLLMERDRAGTTGSANDNPTPIRVVQPAA